MNKGIEDGIVHVNVYEEQGEVIGAAALSESEQTGAADLISFYMLPDRIGQGFGHAFYSSIETELSKKGFSKIVLDVLENNKRAVHFYKTHGFKKNEKKTEVKLGKGEYICVGYEKIIG